MKALVQKCYGNNDCLELRECAVPEPRANEVLIHVSHAGLNPVDYKIRDGKLKSIRPLKFPQIIGNEAAGTIERVGRAVNSFKPGDAVYTRLDSLNIGAFSEHLCVDATLVARIPTGLSFEVAAGVPLVSLTTWQCLYDVAKIQESTKILIHAGAGSVGRIAIQLAKLRGSHVTTTVSDRGEKLVRDLGADEIINYKRTEFTKLGRKFDLVLDTVGGETLDRSFSVCKPGGTVLSIAGMPETNTAKDLGRNSLVLKALFYFTGFKLNNLARQAKCKYRYYFMNANGRQLQELSDLISSGKLKVSIDRVFPISEYRSAFEYLESGKAHGKIVFDLSC